MEWNNDRGGVMGYLSHCVHVEKAIISTEFSECYCCLSIVARADFPIDQSSNINAAQIESVKRDQG